MHFYRKCWFDLFRSNLYPFWTLAKIILCNSDETGFLSDCPSLMLGMPFVVYSILKQCWSVAYVSLLTLSFISINSPYFSKISRGWPPEPLLPREWVTPSRTYPHSALCASFRHTVFTHHKSPSYTPLASSWKFPPLSSFCT